MSLTTERNTPMTVGLSSTIMTKPHHDLHAIKAPNSDYLVKKIYDVSISRCWPTWSEPTLTLHSSSNDLILNIVCNYLVSGSKMHWLIYMCFAFASDLLGHTKPNNLPLAQEVAFLTLARPPIVWVRCPLSSYSNLLYQLFSWSPYQANYMI